MNKLVLYLMNKKGLNILLDLIKHKKHNYIKYIVSSEDKNVEQDFYLDIKKTCGENNIIFYNRREKIPKYDGYKLVVGWRWLIKDNQNLIILHDSLLPRYRGFAPLVNMLINNEKKIGVTALFANDQYDCGDIIEQSSIEIEYPIKILEAIEKISECYVKIVNLIFNKILTGKNIESKKQNNNNATYSLWRDNDDYYIKWKQTSERIKREIDALGSPYNFAKTFLDGKEIRIIEAENVKDVVIEDRKNNLGKVIFFEKGNPIIVAGDGLIKITNAEYTENNKSIFPINKFRVRFGGKDD